MFRYHKAELQLYKNKMVYTTFEVIHINVTLRLCGDFQPGLNLAEISSQLNSKVLFKMTLQLDVKISTE